VKKVKKICSKAPITASQTLFSQRNWNQRDKR